MLDTVVCGGTFDHLHDGHKAFLRFAMQQGKKILIGITSDTYARKKGEGIESYRVRKAALEYYLNHEYSSNRYVVALIDTPFIPDTFLKERIDAIVVTPKTKDGALILNQKRVEKGLSALPILISPLVLAQDKESISSHRIRNGEINRQGVVYIKSGWLHKPRVLPDSLRNELQKPFGEVLSPHNLRITHTDLNRIITVGDVVSKFFLTQGVFPRISVIDFYVQRKKEFQSLSEHGFVGTEHVLHVKNPAGMLTPDAFRICQNALQNQHNQKTIVIQVNGEEDLIVLPLLLVCPLEHVVFYGQPNIGIVQIRVTEAVKERAYKITTRFLTSKV